MSLDVTEQEHTQLEKPTLKTAAKKEK